MSITPDVSLTVGSLHSGFIIRRVTGIPALRGTAYEMEHLVSGARALHLQVDDSENLFSISIPTPPPDNTGLPHILEHAVLAGSRQFPVREPFFEMLKASLATFINAMTGPDCTYYPVASSVKQDLFNLAQVYFDAVFHPLLTEETFQREGHHLAPADRQSPSGPLTVSGIVYNEMKGVYSDPESRLFYTWIRQLLPDTAYALNYAGDPEAIPGLMPVSTFTATSRHGSISSSSMTACGISPVAQARPPWPGSPAGRPPAPVSNRMPSTPPSR
jgi:Zn-dependent M16 (insulinase) family peptidase